MQNLCSHPDLFSVIDIERLSVIVGFVDVYQCVVLFVGCTLEKGELTTVSITSTKDF